MEGAPVFTELNVQHEVKLEHYPLKVLMLAGGRGKRLEEVTGGKIPKCFVSIDTEGRTRGIDHLHNIFQRLGIHDVTFSADYYYDQYEEFVANTQYNMLFQRPGGGNGGAVEQAIEEYGMGSQYLVMSTDTYFSAHDLKKIIDNHSPGTISWGVGKEIPLMESYYGLVVDEATQAILGDTKLPWWKEWDLSGTKQYVKGGIQIIDPIVYMESLNVFKRFCKQEYPHDLYWDVFPLIEERNRRLISRDSDSILQAVVFDDELMDYGAPDRLEATRKLYKP